MISTSSSEKLELLDVKDPNYPDNPHRLLLKVKQSQTVHEAMQDEKRWISGEYEIGATYLTGPLPRKTGSLVCLMGGKVDWDNSVRITNGEVMVKIPELRGLKIGSYLFNRVVSWAKTLEPERRVQQLKLSDVDASSLKNRSRRNRLYRKFGLRLEFVEDAPEAVGHSAYDMTVAELINFPDTEWPSLIVSRRLTPLHDLLVEHQKLKTDIRKAERVAAHYRRQLYRFDNRLARIVCHSRAVFNGPLFIAGIVVGFFLGGFAHSELGQNLSRWMGQL